MCVRRSRTVNDGSDDLVDLALFTASRVGAGEAVGDGGRKVGCAECWPGAQGCLARSAASESSDAAVVDKSVVRFERLRRDERSVSERTSSASCRMFEGSDGERRGCWCAMVDVQVEADLKE